MVLRLHQHNIGYTAGSFYRSDDPSFYFMIFQTVNRQLRDKYRHHSLTVRWTSGRVAECWTCDREVTAANLTTVYHRQLSMPSLQGRLMSWE